MGLGKAPVEEACNTEEECSGEISCNAAISAFHDRGASSDQDSLKGMGVGSALARHVVAQAREKGFTIVPLCPFLKAQAERHADWDDVIEGMKR